MNYESLIIDITTTVNLEPINITYALLVNINTNVNTIIDTNIPSVPIICEDDNISSTIISEQVHNLVYIPEVQFELVPSVTPDTRINDIDVTNETNKNNNTPIENKVRIVASLTSSYHGLQFIKPTLMSLHDQDFDCIYLNIPGKYFSNSRDLIPEWMNICCDVIFCPDLGPILKLLPILDKELNPETIIITLENGVIYPKNMTKAFIQSFKRNNQSAYANCIYKFKSINYFQPITINNNIADIFESTHGVAYLRGFFKNDIISYISFFTKYDFCFYADNVLIMNYLQKYKIHVRCINKKNYNANIIKYSSRGDTLYTSSGLNFKIVFKYYKVIETLQKYNMLYLRNPRSIIDCLRYLSSRPYTVAFN